MLFTDESMPAISTLMAAKTRIVQVFSRKCPSVAHCSEAAAAIHAGPSMHLMIARSLQKLSQGQILCKFALWRHESTGRSRLLVRDIRRLAQNSLRVRRCNAKRKTGHARGSALALLPHMQTPLCMGLARPLHVHKEEF